jgi:hypothetical protein
VRWEIKELNLWPPSVTITPGQGDEAVLHPLFADLEDRTLLIAGYGPGAGITTLDDLAHRVDVIRDPLRNAIGDLRRDASVAEWLRSLQTACHQLLRPINEEMYEEPRSAKQPDKPEVIATVNQLRWAFMDTANHVAAVYRPLPAAANLAQQIVDDIGPRPESG